MKLRYGFIVIGIMRFLSLFKLKHLRKAATYIGPILLSKNTRTTDAIDKNLQLCLPELTKIERIEFSKRRLACMCQTLFEMSHVWIKSPESLKSYLQPSYDNSEFEAQILSDNGIMVLGPHIGNWEIMNVYLSQFRTLTAMYKPLKDPSLDKFIRDARQRFNSVLVPTSNKGITQIIRTLKTKGMVGFLPDQVPEENIGGVFAALFGHQAYTMTLAHKLTLKTKCKVFIGTAYQTEKGFTTRLEPIGDAFYSEDATRAATCLNKAIEEAILLHPVQNQWEYKRYRVQPEGQKSLYK
ncbi:lysophospholipid acyltransferase family protein [Colwellia sp. E2M01]|uniref:lysophospholipid acyltransferase family protein n=1 Tax=Colwellia sp. E2M01 TaxID=2841561 RepID=UPI001C087B72|nr:lysophospholipid acyltransferase family protein [Colwellia sp. E2M01]MBU2869760.1 lysophospholipid acyltransferase family protein [Colwellia sp. E2M01]